MGHLRHGQVPALDGDGSVLAAALSDGLGHSVAVEAAGLPPAAGELAGSALAGGALAAGVPDGAGAWLAPGCGEAPPVVPPGAALGSGDAGGAAAWPGLASEPCEVVMSARVKCSFAWIGTNGAVAA
jgi:hypothetical protein